MIGPRHQPTYLDVVTFENEIDRHHRKLADIQNGASRRKNLDRDQINAKLGAREKVLKFHNSEKALAIEKDNELLLGRLVEISRKRQNPLFPLKEPNHVSKSLNSNFRKKEKDRIAAENEAFARRLLSQQPSFNRRKLDDDYDKHSERVRLMQKAGGFSNKIRLPPIQYHKYEEIDVSRKSQSGKEKRNIKDLGKKKRRKSLKMEKLNEDEKEDLAEQEEQREKEESDRLLREAREQREREEAERKEKEAREQHEREEAERKAAQEEHEKAERLREEEERARLEAQK